MRLKDCVNLKKNKRNNQFSLDIKKKVLKKIDMDIESILDLKIDFPKKMKKLEEL